MDSERWGMIFAHPGHELLATGLMLRHQPDLLFLTRSDSNGDLEREALTAHGLKQLDLLDRSTFLSVSEADIYRWMLQGETTPFLELRERILEWLEAKRPSRVFGDAFELSNVVHDVGRVLFDSAWRSYRRHTACENYEMPLVCRTEPEPWKLRFQEFPSGPYHSIELSQAEIARKEAIADWIGVQRVDAAMARDLFELGREVYRPVSSQRNYTVPPVGLRRHYDEWGRLQTLRGRYTSPILFAEHFVPLVEALPEMSGLFRKSMQRV